MRGETDLSRLLATLSATLADDLFVFATLPGGKVPGGLTPQMVFHEAEGTTLIVTAQQALAHGMAHEFPCRMITLNVHSSLDAVGFIARIATALAGHGMGVNPVAGFYHDHLFVPDGREGDAMRILNDLVAASA